MNNEEENIEDLESLAKRGLELFDEDYNESIEEVLPVVVNPEGDSKDGDAKVIDINNGWRKWVSVAAVLLMGAFGLLMFNNSAVNGADLYASHVEVPPYVISKAVRGVDNADDELSKLEILYEEGSYEKYISSVKIMENRPSETLLYEAISNMQLGRMEEAIEILSDAEAMPTKLNDLRLWNLGLCHLSKENYKSSKEVFKELIDNYQYKHSDAQKILKLIEDY